MFGYPFDTTKHTSMYMHTYKLLLIKDFILENPGCPTWNSLRIRFCNEAGISILSAYLSTLFHYENVLLPLISFSSNLICFFVFMIKSSFSDLILISSNVMSCSLTVLNNILLISIQPLSLQLAPSSGSQNFARFSRANHPTKVSKKYILLFIEL